MVIDSNGAQAHKVMRREVKSHSELEVSRNDPEPGTTEEVSEEEVPEKKKHSIKSAADRHDLIHHYVDEKLPGACSAHYRDQGMLSNDECAERCYNTFGCTRFSAGGCSQGCRISVPNENPDKEAIPADGQCRTTAAGDAGSCIVYQLSFFHAVDQPGACKSHFEEVKEAKNKADCAHACKNTPGCKKFTAEPSCTGGCRISKCDSNPGKHGSKCPADSQCTVSTETGCTVYQVYR